MPWGLEAGVEFGPGRVEPQMSLMLVSQADNAVSAHAEPGGRRAPEHVVSFGLGKPCHYLLIGVVETLEPSGQAGDRHVVAEHAARGAAHLGEGEDPGGDLLPVPAHTEDALDRRD